jgi:phosphate transport system substrate-binding protein
VLNLFFAMALVACGAAEPSARAETACVPGSITIAGSTAIQPLVAAAAKLYMSACPGASIDVQGGGSLVGLQQLSAGTVAIADSDVTADALNITALVNHVVARQGFAIVTAKGLPIANLTQRQATDIFTCRTTNWKNVGGPDKPIAVIVRPVTSGTRATFRSLVLNGQDECQSATTLSQDSSEAVRQAVEETSGAVSVIGLAYLADPIAAQNLAAVKYEDVEPSATHVNDGTYKIVADANMYTKGKVADLTKAFLNFMLTDQVQKQLVPSLNFAPVE